MFQRSLITYLLFALCAVYTVCAAASFEVISPTSSDVYKVGQDIVVKIKTAGGKTSKIYMDDPLVTLSIQKAIPKPNLNKIVTEIKFQELHDSGYSFVAKEEYIIDTQTTIPFRVRASTDSFGYTDSAGFKIEK